jgi:Ca-activated chloride channel family protein
MRRRLALALLLAASFAGAAGAAPRFDIGLIEPAAGVPVIGPVRVTAEVRGGQALTVEFWLDGRLVGARDRPPWSLEIDTGEAIVEHRIRVVAVAASGARAEAELITPKIQIDEVVELPLQQAYVTATRGGTPVLDLRRDELRVVEGEREQKLVTFERGDIPLAALLLLDSSLSMRGKPLDAALGGARAFAAGMAPLDEAQLVLFSDRVVHRTDFTRDPDELVADLSGALARGGSAIHDHLMLALLELEKRQGRRAVVLLSDGVDVESVLNVADLESVTGRSSALVYWIRIREGGEGAGGRSIWRDYAQHTAELASLELLVAASGGRVLDIARPEEAAHAFGEVLAELRRQYVLGWYPDGLRHDGSWRPIRIECARKDVELRARQGYFDD